MIRKTKTGWTVKIEGASYVLNSKQDLTPELIAYLRLVKRVDVMDTLIPSPGYNDPTALRDALRAAIDGRPDEGRKILGITVYDEIAAKLFVSSDAAKSLAHGADIKAVCKQHMREEYWVVYREDDLVQNQVAEANTKAAKEWLVLIGKPRINGKHMVFKYKSRFPSRTVAESWRGHKLPENEIYERLCVDYRLRLTPGNHGAPWSDNEYAVLVNTVQEDGYVDLLRGSQVLGRTPWAILCRLFRMGAEFNWNKTLGTLCNTHLSAHT